MPDGWVRVEMLVTIDQKTVVMELPKGAIVELPPEVAYQLLRSDVARLVPPSKRLEAAALAAPGRRG